MTRKHYIYCYRSGCGRRRQPTHAAGLDVLEISLRNDYGKGHPYDLNHIEKHKLLGPSLAKLAGVRKSAKLPDTDYLYRVCTIQDFMYNSGLSLSASDKADAPSVWERLNTKSGGRWLALPSGHGKTYSGCGGISWWTDYSLPADLVLGALKAGMFTNWLVPNSVLLRCKVSFIQAAGLAFVPTILDAFCQLVFHPRREVYNPSFGKAIDLSQRGALCTGASEFVLRSVDCSEIEYLPIPVTSDMKKAYKGHNEFNVKFIDRIIEYYKVL